MTFAAKAKNFLKCWNFIIFGIGIALMVITVYNLILKDDRFAIPSFFYYSAMVSGILLASVAIVGHRGLIVHKKIISTGKRNYTLIAYVVISLIASLFVILGGLVALKLHDVIMLAVEEEYADTGVQFLEQSVVEKLSDYAVQNPKSWINVQDANLCCGYQDPEKFKDYLPDEYQIRAAYINQIAGSLCTSDEDHCGKGKTNPCPRLGTKWCRYNFYKDAAENSVSIGTVSMLLGASQILAFVLSLYILLCDSRVVDETKKAKNKMSRV